MCVAGDGEVVRETPGCQAEGLCGGTFTGKMKSPGRVSTGHPSREVKYLPCGSGTQQISEPKKWIGMSSAKGREGKGRKKKEASKKTHQDQQQRGREPGGSDNWGVKCCSVCKEGVINCVNGVERSQELSAGFNQVAFTVAELGEEKPAWGWVQERMVANSRKSV